MNARGGAHIRRIGSHLRRELGAAIRCRHPLFERELAQRYFCLMPGSKAAAASTCTRWSSVRNYTAKRSLLRRQRLA